MIVSNQNDIVLMVSLLILSSAIKTKHMSKYTAFYTYQGRIDKIRVVWNYSASNINILQRIIDISSPMAVILQEIESVRILDGLAQ